MKIVVLVKEVPDTWGDRRLNLETGLLERGAGELVLDEIGERAIEVALTHAEANPGSQVVLLAMGPASVPTTLRKGLAMGADRAIHVLDDALLGADTTLTATTLAAALARETFDLVIAGNLSTDGGGAVIPSMIAELLDVPAATGLSTVDIAADTVTGRRDTEVGSYTVRAELPAVISITEALPDARFPSFKGIMAAKKKAVDTVSLADIASGAGAAEGTEAHSIVISVAERPARTAGVTIVDEGDAGTQLAEFLAKNQLI
ncbi:MAG: electron transfer flavoprotein subunit beta/FixA family protein [Rhodoglobus sp.]